MLSLLEPPVFHPSSSTGFSFLRNSRHCLVYGKRSRPPCTRSRVKDFSADLTTCLAFPAKQLRLSRFAIEGKIAFATGFPFLSLRLVSEELGKVRRNSEEFVARWSTYLVRKTEKKIVIFLMSFICWMFILYICRMWSLNLHIWSNFWITRLMKNCLIQNKNVIFKVAKYFWSFLTFCNSKGHQIYHMTEFVLNSRFHMTNEQNMAFCIKKLKVLISWKILYMYIVHCCYDYRKPCPTCTTLSPCHFFLLFTIFEKKITFDKNNIYI